MLFETFGHEKNPFRIKSDEIHTQFKTKKQLKTIPCQATCPRYKGQIRQYPPLHFPPQGLVHYPEPVGDQGQMIQQLVIASPGLNLKYSKDFISLAENVFKSYKEICLMQHKSKKEKLS